MEVLKVYHYTVTRMLVEDGGDTFLLDIDTHGRYTMDKLERGSRYVEDWVRAADEDLSHLTDLCDKVATT